MSYDGALKAWDAESLDIVVDRWARRGLQPVCLAHMLQLNQCWHGKAMQKQILPHSTQVRCLPLSRVFTQSLPLCPPPLCRSNAHGGERVHCLAVGPDGLLYSGGSDKVRL